MQRSFSDTHSSADHQTADSAPRHKDHTEEDTDFLQATGQMWYPIPPRYGRTQRAPPAQLGRMPSSHPRHSEPIRTYGLPPSWGGGTAPPPQPEAYESNQSTSTTSSEERAVRRVHGLVNNPIPVSFRDRSQHQADSPTLKADIRVTLMRLNGTMDALEDVTNMLEDEAGAQDAVITPEQLAVAVQINKAYEWVRGVAKEMKALRERSSEQGPGHEFSIEHVADSIETASHNIRHKIATMGHELGASGGRPLSRRDRARRDQLVLDMERLEVQLARMLKTAMNRENASSRHKERHEDLKRLRADTLANQTYQGNSYETSGADNSYDNQAAQ